MRSLARPPPMASRALVAAVLSRGVQAQQQATTQCAGRAAIAPSGMFSGRRSLSGQPRLAGGNLFQARAAAAVQEGAAAATAAEPIALPTSDESDALLRIRHSCAHIMAMAVQRIYKDAHVTQGPWTDRGFFYDFEIKEQVRTPHMRTPNSHALAVATIGGCAHALHRVGVPYLSSVASHLRKVFGHNAPSTVLYASS
jgi:hypothetical protein